MVKVSRKLLLTIFLAFILLTPFVLGKDFLEPIFSNFRGTDLGRTYQNYAAFIDAILYFWLFIGLSKSILGEKVFKDSKAVPTVIGIMLGIGMCVFEYTSKFNIGKLAPFAALLFFIILGIAIYNWTKKLGGEGAPGKTLTAFSLAFLIIYAFANWAAKPLIDWMYQVEWLSTILSILFIASIIGLIYGMVQLFKGMKSKAAAVGQAEYEDKHANKIFRTETDKDNKTLGREKKAAENMFKLESELGQINQNLTALSQAEASAQQRNLTDRGQQIQTLIELENALNGTWRVQAQLQEAYKKALTPEYASHPEYLETIKASARDLDGFITRVRTLLGTLHSKIKETKTEYETELKGIEQQLEAEFNRLQANFEKSSQQEQEIQKFIQQLSTLNIKDKAFEDQKLLRFRQYLDQKQQLLQKIKYTQQQLALAQKSIYDLDSKHLDELSKSVNVAEKNPAEDIGKLRRGLNIAMNGSNITEDIGQGADAGKGTISRLAGMTDAIISSGFKYLSGDSLRQIFESVKSVHLGIQQIRNELIPKETQLRMDRWNALKNYENIENAVIKELREEMARQMQDIQKDFNDNVLLMQSISNNLKNIISALQSTKYTGARAKAAEIAKFIKQLSDEENFCNSKVYNIPLRDLLKTQIAEIRKVLVAFQNSTDKKVDDEAIRALEIIKKNLERNINDQTTVFSQVKDILNVPRSTPPIGTVNPIR